MPGRFLVFEGIDGSGKSTQAGRLAWTLLDRGEPTITTREPGGTPLGDTLRNLLLEGEEVDARAELMLFQAARAQHVTQLIRPMLKAGVTVICDRFTGSSIAYQGAARGHGEVWVQDLSHWSAYGVTPDRTIVLDVDPLLGLNRVQKVTRMEAEGVGFLRAARESFLWQAQHSLAHRVIDASQSADAVAAEVLEFVDGPLP